MTTKEIPIISFDLRERDETIKRLTDNLFNDNIDSNIIKISEDTRKNLRSDVVKMIGIHSVKNKDRNDHVSNIHNKQNILVKDSFIWLIADARDTGDKVKELEYAKK